MSKAMEHAAPPIALRQHLAAPRWTLLLLAPFIAELLSGSTRTGVIFVYLPEVMVWGVGALVCRELVRRWRAGGVSLLCLALALSIAEEFIIQQTSLAPLPFPGSHPEYGRIWGVNLVYFLYMLGYESVWVVLVPVQLTELLFPRQAALPWLGKRGAITACAVFVAGARIAWYGWTQQARPRLHAAAYRLPTSMLAVGLAAILLLIAMAYLLRGVGRRLENDRRSTVPAWVGGSTALLMGLAWWYLIVQNFIPKPVQPFWTVVIAGVGWAALALTLFVGWSSRAAWSQVHQFAAALGATLACMAGPYLTIRSWPTIDIVGKLVFDCLALAGFILLAKKVFTRSGTAKIDALAGGKRPDEG